MDMCSAVSSARREKDENRPEPPARASASGPTRGPLSLPSLAPQSHQITRHTLPSKFRRISNKTNDWYPRQVTHFSKTGPPVSTPNRAPEATVSGAREISRVWEIEPRRANLDTNHDFLIDTPAIRNALNSSQLSAEFISNRHRSRCLRSGRLCGTGSATHASIVPNYSTHVPSKFRANPFKTKDWGHR